jgi:predicted Zn-dependent protease
MVCGISGCLTADTDRFGRTSKTAIPPRDKLPKGSLEAASRVDSIGRQIRGANPDISVDPLFLTIGSPSVTAFHRGTTEIYVSDGVVQRCKTDGELAAVLCNELAKMTVEAQAQGKTKPPPERERPFTPSLHRGGDPDQTQLAEQALFERQNPRRRPVDAPVELDPGVLAKDYLTKAGFAADDLAKAGTLIRQAEANPSFNQILAPRSEGLGIPKQP